MPEYFLRFSSKKIDIVALIPCLSLFVKTFVFLHLVGFNFGHQTLLESNVKVFVEEQSDFSPTVSR